MDECLMVTSETNDAAALQTHHSPTKMMTLDDGNRRDGLFSLSGTNSIVTTMVNGLSESATEQRESHAARSDANYGSSHPENALSILKAIREFHSRRFLKVKHLPTDATDEDIRQLLQPLEIKDVQLNRGLLTAKVVPATPECLEAWPSEAEYSLRDNKVIVAPSCTEGMLCIAHLPLIFTEQEFSNLVQMYGPVARCFLLRNEKTGEHKGYGFVEYSSKDVAYKARNLLDKKVIGDCTLHCNWIDPSHLTYSSLHSKCLFVDHLPPHYRDLVEFRKIFSIHVSPSYCQIALKNGQPLGFGLVEFENASDAEETQKRLNHYQIEEYKIRVTYCIPGYRAMVIYNKLMNSGHLANGKKPLLPDPPVSSTAFGQLHMLALQNPQLFQSIQSLAASQYSNGSARMNGANSTLKETKSPPHSHQPGILGHAPSPATSPTLSSSSLSSTSSTATNSSTSVPGLPSTIIDQMNPNLQAALVLLLATQMQSQLGVQQPSLLGNPQLLSLIQAILKQQTCQTGSADPANGLQHILSLLQKNEQNHITSVASTQHNVADPKDTSELTANHNVKSWTESSLNFSNSHCDQWQSQQKSTFVQRNDRDGTVPFMARKVPLLPDPPTAKMDKGLLPTPEPGKTNNLLGSQQLGTKPLGALHNGQSIFHPVGLLETLDCNGQSTPKTSLLGPKPTAFNDKGCKPPLLGDKPNVISSASHTNGGFPPAPVNGSSTNDSVDATSKMNFLNVPLPASTTTNPLLASSNSALQQILPVLLNRNPLYELPKSQSQQEIKTISPPVAKGIALNGTIPIPASQNGSGLTFGNITPNPNVTSVPSQQHLSTVAALAQMQKHLQLNGMNPAFMGLLLQMSQGVDGMQKCGEALQASVQQAAVAQQQQQNQRPQTNPQPPKNGFHSLGNGYNGARFANFVSPPAAYPMPPLATLMAMAASHKSPVVGFSPSPFLVPTPQPGPPNMARLVAEIQQRGSLLGDFWQVAQGEVPTMFSVSNGKFPVIQPVVASTPTPVNGKRKLHVLLPSPEASPEGCYIGQHSQGIGGHYADSYLKKKKL